MTEDERLIFAFVVAMLGGNLGWWNGWLFAYLVFWIEVAVEMATRGYTWLPDQEAP